MPNKEAIAKAPAGRVRRNGFGTKNVLTVSGKEPGFVYRFVNDESDRIQDFLDMGYELVEQKGVRIGDKRLSTPTDAGGGSKAIASVGQGKKAYLMRIREDWYNEDQADKQREVDRLEASTVQDALSGTDYGELK